MIYYIEETPNNLFFDLIAKNATNSILNALTNYKNSNYTGEESFNGYSLVPQQVIDFNANKNLFFNNIYSEKNTINFTCIRDPYHRVVSAYINKILNGSTKEFIVDFFNIYGEDLSVFRNEKEKYFNVFIDFIENSNSETLDGHVKPQSKLLELELKKYDYVFKVDELAKSWNIVMDLFPGMPNLPKNKLNASESMNFIDEIDWLGLERIKKIYQDDYDIFNSIE